jgi:hypothetical protein
VEQKDQGNDHREPWIADPGPIIGQLGHGTADPQSEIAHLAGPIDDPEPGIVDLLADKADPARGSALWMTRRSISSPGAPIPRARRAKRRGPSALLRLPTNNRASRRESRPRAARLFPHRKRIVTLEATSRPGSTS